MSLRIARLLSAGWTAEALMHSTEHKEKYGEIPQAGGGARGRSDSRRSPPDPVRRGTMSKSVRPVPEGHPTVSPYLIVNDGAAALDFYKKAFGATELMRHTDPNGKVGHAEITIGDSVIMLADEFPDFGARSPRAIGGSPVGIHLYVEGVDAVASQAIAAGAKVVRPVADQFYGDRNGTLEDPFGHIWHISTHVEDVPPEKLSRRVAALKAH